MQLKRIKLSDNSEIWVIVDDFSVPVTLPSIYIVSFLQYKALSTQNNHLSIILKLYNHFFDKGKKLEVLLEQGDFQTVFKELEYFFNIVLRYNKQNPRYYNLNVGYLGDYIKWSLERFLNNREAVSSNSNMAGPKNLKALNKIRSKEFFDSFMVQSKGSKRAFRSLTRLETGVVMRITDIDSPINPFAEQLKLRNHIIIELLKQTGIRLGEMLLLRVSDIIGINTNYYIKIEKADSCIGSSDTRSNRPNLKNSRSERIVSISEDFFFIVDLYIKKFRRPMRNNKKMKLAHPFLLVSDQGKPISKSTIAYIFSSINNKAKANDRKWETISPHDFRHTFACDFLRFLIEVQNIDFERAKDELRQICGWNENSVMPTYYGGRYTSEMANKHNEERIRYFYNHKAPID